MRHLYAGLILFPLAFLACQEEGLHLKIRYDQVQGLEEGNRLIFDDNEAGAVTRVFYTEEGFFIVDVTIKKNFANAATEYARFYIIDDPLNKGQKALEMIQAQKGGTLLADGATVGGATRASAQFDQLLSDFERGIGSVQKQFEQFLSELGRLSESDELRQLEKELQALGQEMQRAGKAVQEKVQKEILPQLKKELESLKERLQKFGRQKEVEPLEEQLEKLKTI
ncbi:MAG: OmpH family outer membrane protein [Desulfobacterales bacterium]|nr:MAG: OmpH family outer membrane protein [Desulfobacterales bacterium]